MVEFRHRPTRSYNSFSGSKRRNVERTSKMCLILSCLSLMIVFGGCLAWVRETRNARPAARPNREDGRLRKVFNHVPIGSESVDQRGAPAAPVVAFAISVTKLELPKASTMLDSVEVLLRSIRATCKLSRYRCETVAITLRSVSQDARRHLENIGWRVIERDLPVAVEEIENESYRNHVGKTGCCGADEFIKLHAYTLTEYHRVVHVDADTLILHPMDELMESNASLLYTTDPVMATKHSKALPVQGGFLLVRPDLEVYDALRAIVREGDWQIGSGWARSNIGYFYGGATIQGLLPYYYNVVAPGTAKEVNRCLYNHMSDSDECRSNRFGFVTLGTEEQAPSMPATTTLSRQSGQGLAEGAPLGGTRSDVSGAASGVSAIKSVHFTQSCRKPWFCGRMSGKQDQGSCPLLQHAWLEGRKRVMRDMGLPVTEACVNGHYSPIPRPGVEQMIRGR